MSNKNLILTQAKQKTKRRDKVYPCTRKTKQELMNEVIELIIYGFCFCLYEDESIEKTLKLFRKREWEMEEGDKKELQEIQEYYQSTKESIKKNFTNHTNKELQEYLKTFGRISRSSFAERTEDVKEMLGEIKKELIKRHIL